MFARTEFPRFLQKQILTARTYRAEGRGATKQEAKRNSAKELIPMIREMMLQPLPVIYSVKSLLSYMQ